MCFTRTMFLGVQKCCERSGRSERSAHTEQCSERTLRYSFFQQLAKRLCPSELYLDSVQGGTVGLKSYCMVVESHRAGNIGIQRWHSTLAFSIDIQHWHSKLAFNIGIQHSHSTLAFSMGIQHGHSALAFSMGIQHWHWTLAFGIGIRH